MAKTKHPLELLAAYAIGSLTDAEKAEVSAHLATCANCRKELAKLETMVAKLSAATPAQIVPARVKQSLLNKVRQQSKSSRVTGKRWWETIFATPAYATVSLVLILGLIVSNLLLWRELQQQTATPAPVAQTLSLENTGKLATGTALLVMSGDGQHATLIVEDLPNLTSEQQYQLWLIEDGQPASAGVFTVSRDGYFALSVDSQIAFNSYSAFGISIEPFGGSPAPTGDIVFYHERGA
jgi:anti-sigma-K factor RskA